MKHYGDITKINGQKVPTVDVITGGSPCQDLSVAGLRKGLAGERSGLFMEQMRIIKEMRDLDKSTGRTGCLVRPRFMVWENVEGALSSPGGDRKGEDFAAVIEEIIKVAEPNSSVHVCVPDGGWTKSGCYYAEDGSWSIAYRVLDAQFWGPTQYVDGRVLFSGTPQRRKRIALVADFGGLSAPEILFERKGLSRNPEPLRETRQENARETENSTGETGKPGACAYTVKVRGGTEIDSHGKRAGKGVLVQEEKSGTLGATQDQFLITIDQPRCGHADSK